MTSRTTFRPRSAGLADHGRGVDVEALADVGGVPEQSLGRPLGERHLHHELRPAVVRRRYPTSGTPPGIGLVGSARDSSSPRSRRRSASEIHWTASGVGEPAGGVVVCDDERAELAGESSSPSTHPATTSSWRRRTFTFRHDGDRRPGS